MKLITCSQNFYNIILQCQKSDRYENFIETLISLTESYHLQDADNVEEQDKLKEFYLANYQRNKDFDNLFERISKEKIELVNNLSDYHSKFENNKLCTYININYFTKFLEMNIPENQSCCCNSYGEKGNCFIDLRGIIDFNIGKILIQIHHKEGCSQCHSWDNEDDPCYIIDFDQKFLEELFLYLLNSAKNTRYFKIKSSRLKEFQDLEDQCKKQADKEIEEELKKF